MKRRKKFNYPQYFLYYYKRKLLIKYLVKEHYKRLSSYHKN